MTPTTDINISSPNDGLGTTLRDGGQIINDNFAVVQADTAQVQSNLTAHENDLNNPHSVTKAQVGLSNVDNTSDANKPVSSATQSALDDKQSKSEKGVANGYASLDSGGKVPLTQIPATTGTGDMQKLTYDPADISEQLVGETATQTISNKTLDNTSSVGFNTAAGVIVGEGEIAWNDEDGTLDVGMKGGNVTGQMFEELFIYAKASEAITNGDVVYKSGVVGGSAKLEISKYIADGTIDPILVLGIATEDIAIGEFGFVTTFGKIRGLDTSAYAEDTILYASPTTAGAYTDIEPTAPNIKAPIALVTYSQANNGVLSTERIYIPKIEDLNGIQITSPTTGQSMIYDGTKWVNGTLSASNVSNTPAGNISATTVQGAINELDTEKEPTITKNTAFNKNFGTTAGTVLEGSKDAEYAKLASVNTFTNDQRFNGNIGIGKDPILPADIVGEIRSSDGTGFARALSIVNPTASTPGRLRVSNTSQDLRIGTRDFQDSINILGSNGNVGIGTTSPEAKFHSRTSAVTGASYITEANGIIEGVDGCLELVSDRIGSYASTLALTSTDGTNHNNWAIVNGGVSVGGRLRFMYGNTPASGLSNINQEFMSVTTGGNVGINKTNPLSKFAVVGLPTSSAGLTSGDVWRNGTVLNIIA